MLLKGREKCIILCRFTRETSTRESRKKRWADGVSTLCSLGRFLIFTTAGAGTPWKDGVLREYNYDRMQLTKYSEVWFAAKPVNAYWAFVSDDKKNREEIWLYFHLTNKGPDEDGFTRWDIEISVGGIVYERLENQSGRQLDMVRPTDSIARLLWSEGFSSEGKRAILIYPSFPDGSISPTIYCTEILGVEKAL